MKKLLPLILFLAFALNSCDDCCLPPYPYVNNNLDFSELVSIMGKSTKQARDKMPGALSEVHTDTTEAEWIFNLVPEGINMDDSLRMSYTFVNDTLVDIWMLAANEDDALDLTKQITTTASEQLGEGEYRLIWFSETSVESKDFSIAKALWDFVEANNINLTDILQASGTWEVDEYEVFLAYANSKNLQFTGWIQGPPISYEMREMREAIIVLAPDSCGLQ